MFIGLFSEIFTHDLQALQCKILLHEISGENEDEHRVDEASDASGEVL